jgi:hypothetical protein
MIDNMNINIYIGILFLGFFIKMSILYRNFYKISKNLDTDERIKFFNNKYIIATISKFNIIKNIFIFYILVPMIKINYFILSIFISLIHSLCEIEYDDFMEKNGFSFNNFNNDEIEKILNNNSDDEKNDDELINNSKINNMNEKNKLLENKEKLIDQKIEFYMKNQNNIENLNINNLENYEKLQNLIINNDYNFDLNTNLNNINSNVNIEELKKDINIINEGIEVLKIDDIDFGDNNLNTFFNNFNNKENKIKVDNTDNIVVIKAGKKKINK